MRRSFLWIVLLAALLPVGPAAPASADCPESGLGSFADRVRCLDRRVRQLELELNDAVIAFEAIACPAGWIEFVPKKGKQLPDGPLLDLPLILCRRL